MAKKKTHERGATIAEIEAQLQHFSLFEDCDVPEIVAPPAARPAPAPKAVRLSWDAVDMIDTDAAWDAFLRNT